MIYQKAEKIEKIKHIYIHIPFCKKKCFYCDFYSEPVNSNVYFKYTLTLIKELNLYYDFLNKNLKSIYFGGGTPYLLNLNNLKKTVYSFKNFIDNKTEITIELNPYNFIDNKNLIFDLSNIGFNRFSIGVQTFDTNISKSINRLIPTDFDMTLKKLNKFNINLDFMFGIKNQTIKTIKQDLNLIKEIYPTHLSYYLFTVPKKIKTPSITTQEAMYSIITNSLKKHYIHYEVSNFSKHKKYFCKHNLAYWNRKRYLGIGAAAHSFVKHKSKELRYSNISSYSIYIKDFRKINMIEKLTKKQIFYEKILLSLRLLKKGVDTRMIKQDLKPLKSFLDLKNKKATIKENKIFLIDELSSFIISD